MSGRDVRAVGPELHHVVRLDGGRLVVWPGTSRRLTHRGLRVRSGDRVRFESRRWAPAKRAGIGVYVGTVLR